MSDRVVLDGELSLNNLLDGETETVIKVGDDPVIESLDVTENGTYEAVGVDGYAPVIVNIPIPSPVIDSLSVTENGTYIAPDGKDGYSPIVVNVPMQTIPWKTVTLEEDHTRDAIGLVTYWGTFLEIPNDPDNTYFADFTNNSAAGTIKCDFIWWKGTATISSRNNYSNISNATVRSCYASAGTVIRIYKLPK